jgi:hypothetical protein
MPPSRKSIFGKRTNAKKKVTPLGKASSFYNATSKRPNAYSTWGTSKPTVKKSRVVPEAQKKKKNETMSQFEARKDYESVKDPKGKSGWRTALKSLLTN